MKFTILSVIMLNVVAPYGSLPLEKSLTGVPRRLNSIKN